MSRWARTHGRRNVAMAFLAVAVPFGSLSTLEHRICTGSIVSSVSQGHFLSVATSSPSYITYRVAWLKKHPPRGPVVYLLGGSATRETLTNAADFAADIAARGRVAPAVQILAAMDQNPSETLAIVDNLPRTKGVVLIIGVNEKTFFSGVDSSFRELDGHRMIMKSPVLRAFVTSHTGLDPGNDLDPGTVMFLKAYESFRGVPAFRGPYLRYELHRYVPPPLGVRDKRKILLKLLTQHLQPGQDFDTNFDYGEATLRRTVRLARSKGYRVLLMETSIDSQIVGSTLDGCKATYLLVFARIVSDFGAYYCDLNETAGLFNGDFRDIYHLLPTGRQKWTPLLADVVAQIYAGTYQTSWPTPGASPTPSDSPSSSPSP